MLTISHVKRTLLPTHGHEIFWCTKLCVVLLIYLLCWECIYLYANLNVESNSIHFNLEL